MQTLEEFIQKWSESQASERANKDAFLMELCEVLGVDRPNPTTGDAEKDTYVFEGDVRIPHEGDSSSIGKMDLYKKGCLILEAKQGSTAESKKIGTAKRGTGGWYLAMQEAYGQALKYAKHVDSPPPFLVICDIGYCFDIYASFDGSTHYSRFPNPQKFRFFLKDLAQNAETLKKIFTDPLALDPAKQVIKVTREVAGKLAELSKDLEGAGHHSETVATFLMRCIFTMFAEDVGLLPHNIFTDSIERFWLPSPKSFPNGVRALWKAMNDGGDTMVAGKLLKFNGGLFASQDALPLNEKQLQLLLDAAKMDWSDVEPAIFGTLLERALNPKERHALGAHYTPKAYVERLVRPTIEEPLREEWNLVKAEAMHLVESDDMQAARKVVRAFHSKLCQTKVLDPACGSGNFLYVTLEMFKRLEGEVLSMLEAFGESMRFDWENLTVNPSQFLGIEVKRWAKEIAEMVLWIGYLQWHVRTYARDEKTLNVPEPVLQNYGNIECRDAVLAYDKEEIVIDDHGKPLTQWDGETMKEHPVTGKDIPDETAAVVQYRYINPRKAEWPKADYVVGNPPFVGSKRMRTAIGDGYVDALRSVYRELPETIDFVMYWWNYAASLLSTGQIRQFGFITTNSISQTSSRKVLQNYLESKLPLSVVFAIPDHPWVDSESGAQVRIGMTVAAPGKKLGILRTVTSESFAGTETVSVELSSKVGIIHSNLKAGANLTTAIPLLANAKICWQGCKLVGSQFQIDSEQKTKFVTRQPECEERLPRYWAGRDITQKPTERYVVDMFGLSEEESRGKYPILYQYLYDHVRPIRIQNRDKTFREKWWVFGRPRPDLRLANSGLNRYIVTSEVAKFRVFTTLTWPNNLVDGGVIAIALSDSYHLGILSSKIHVIWSAATGGRMGVGNDLRYQNGPCFDPFPFPACSSHKKKEIAKIAEKIEKHRKEQIESHPEITLTSLYNVLSKLQGNEKLSHKEARIYQLGLVQVLAVLHNELDAAVYDAYGWKVGESEDNIIEWLLDLNHQRATEERNGIIKWLRPEFQRANVRLPGEIQESQETISSAKQAESSLSRIPSMSENKRSWPKTLPERISAIRDLIQNSEGTWTSEDVKNSFKRAQVKSVEPVLESLAAVGVLVQYQSHDVVKWRRVD
ncbi:MAG: class I SAM-dependent DNA methyltransferase [Deltaproteobacteria bacterium]|nr:class I SAM-dependent DNA methyltransferase [Deltaproteobacteria bacterium]